MWAGRSTALLTGILHSVRFVPKSFASATEPVAAPASLLNPLSAHEHIGEPCCSSRVMFDPDPQKDRLIAELIALWERRKDASAVYAKDHG
jgi:hypothetical protein